MAPANEEREGERCFVYKLCVCLKCADLVCEMVVVVVHGSLVVVVMGGLD